MCLLRLCGMTMAIWSQTRLIRAIALAILCSNPASVTGGISITTKCAPNREVGGVVICTSSCNFTWGKRFALHEARVFDVLAVLTQPSLNCVGNGLIWKVGWVASVFLASGRFPPPGALVH